MTEKFLLETHIEKIFQVILNSDSVEIMRIGLETLANRCIENPNVLFIIFKNLIDICKKGNLKIIEESKILIDSIFEELGENFLQKLFLADFLRSQLENLLEEDSIKEIKPCLMTINTDSTIIRTTKLEVLRFKSISTLDIRNIEKLYSNKTDEESIVNDESGAGAEIMNKDELDILFPSKDEFKMEIEKCLNTKNVSNNHRNNNIQQAKKKIIKISDFINSNIESVGVENYLTPEVNAKKRKLSENECIRSSDVIFTPFLSVVGELLELNLNSVWKVRLSAITLLNILEPYFDKVLFKYFKVFYSANKNNENGAFAIDEIVINELPVDKQIDEINFLIKENIITRIFINSLLDRVVDFNSEDHICIFKQLNLKLCHLIINTIPKTKVDELNTVVVTLLQNNSNDSDWQPIYSILTYIKFQTETFLSQTQKSQIFTLIERLFNLDSEEVLNLTTQILDNLINSQIDDNRMKTALVNIFPNYLRLIDRYDDIEVGVKYYFKCLLSFILFLKNKGLLAKFSNLIDVMEKDLIYYSLNKLTVVRIKYFEIINNLIDIPEFKFSNNFLENNILLAYQGLCIEENKDLLEIQQKFLVKIILVKGQIDFFMKNAKKLLKLMIKENLNDIKYFFIPQTDKYDLESLYTSFFVNNMQTEIIRKNFDRKIRYISSLMSLIIKQKIDFVKTLLSYFKIDLNNIVLSKRLLIFLRIYFIYLELIEQVPNKILILNDKLLNTICDSNSINELYIHLNKNEVETSIGVIFKLFLEFLNKLPNKCRELITEESASLENFSQKLYRDSVLNPQEIRKLLKSIYDKVKPFSEEIQHKLGIPLYENFKCFTEQITSLDNNFTTFKHLLRGYAGICIFLHSVYAGVKYEKVSIIAHPLLNCLKFNVKECKYFARYLIKLLYTVGIPDTVNKIIFKFLENSIDIYVQDFIKKDSFVKFLPVKYFFGEFSKFKKFDDIVRIFGEYKISLQSNASENPPISENKKLIILLYLMTFINNDIKCIGFDSFFKLVVSELKKETNESEINSLTKIISKILIEYKKVFFDLFEDNKIPAKNSNNNILKIFKAIFKELQESDNNSFIYSLLTLVEHLNHSELFQIQGTRFIFDILKFINDKDDAIRQLAVNMFSKSMKNLIMLKLDKNYENLFNSTEDEGSRFINNIFTGASNGTSNDIAKYMKMSEEHLRTYQLNGINWLRTLGSYGLGLALCDEMGLGKTIQTLACVIAESNLYRERSKAKPINLIICPNTLVLNWLQEYKKFFNTSEVSVFKFENEIKPGKNDKIEIYITSYEKVRDNTGIFSAVNFFYLVLDEAHIIKNPKTKLYNSIRSIRSERRVILTGTPIQNNVMELWSLFDFLMPGFLGSENDFEIKFHKKIHSNIKKLNLEEKLQEKIFQTSLHEIRRRIKPFILRRLKQDVLKELPEKIIQDYICEMTQVQKDLYAYWEQYYDKPETNKKNGKDKNNTKTSNSTLKTIDVLRKICNYPGLLAEERFLKENEVLRNINHDMLINPYNSGKLKSLEEILINLGFADEDLECYDNKVLIFSQYKSMVEMISAFIGKEFPHLGLLKLSSDVSADDRARLVNSFNSDPNIHILVLTTSIGGLGLSLTSANIVIMYDHDWNPMRDLQAMDRAHRIGQKKTVEVFR
jgi:SNF2 family DNA or RNA helicase